MPSVQKDKPSVKTKKDIKKDIAQLLETSLSSFKVAGAEKRFLHTIEKASKILAKGFSGNKTEKEKAATAAKKNTAKKAVVKKNPAKKKAAKKPVVKKSASSTKPVKAKK